MERRVKSSNQIIITVFFILFFIWILLQFIAPFALPKDSVKDLSGTTVVSDNEDVIDDMSFPWDSIYRLGDSLCHQKAERSFFLNGNQMPFCSRCTAIWIGLAIGLFLMVVFKIALNEKFLILLFIAIIPIGIDGIGQLFGLWESNNVIRVITGLLIGFVCGIAIGIIIDEIIGFKNKTKD
jgi:uncharacterized membrane protein